MPPQGHSRSVGLHADVAGVVSTSAPEGLLDQLFDMPWPSRLRVRCETDRVDHAYNAPHPAYGSFRFLALIGLIHNTLQRDHALMHDRPDLFPIQRQLPFEGHDRCA